MARVDFDALAASYEAARAIPIDGLTAWREALSPYLPPAGRLPLLDLGCGTGQFAVLLADWFGVHVVAVEPSPGMLAQARALRPHPGISYVRGDAGRIPFARQSCGAAWLSTVIHHLPSLSDCASELGRVLASGGRVLIRSSFPGRHEHITLFRFFPGASRIASTFPSVETVAAAFRPAGFEIEALASVPQRTAPSLAALRERIASRADTTLQLLDDAQFADGLARLDAAIADEAAPSPVVDRLDLLVLGRPEPIR